MANEVAKTDKKEVTQSTGKMGIASFLAQEAVKANVESVVGVKDSQRFISSVVSAVQTNPQLAECTNASILSAALMGQSLNLPQSPQLGYFYMVPYDNKKKGAKEAQFMVSYRGLIQLAMRSGQYKSMNVTSIKEGELKSYDPIRETFEFEAITDFAEREKAPVIGYYGYFELTNGYRKEVYWSKERMDAHAKRYSASYKNGWKSSLWVSDFDTMAYKTIIRFMLNKWGIVSVEMETAYKNDMAVIDENGNPIYVDNPATDIKYEAHDIYAENEEETPVETIEDAQVVDTPDEEAANE